MLGTSHAPQSHPPYDDEIDLLELWRVLMRGKWIIIGFTAIFSVASVFYALSLPNMYKSTAVLAPAESAGGGGLGKLAGQFGGLASLAGINLGGGGSNKTAEALEILQSWAFIEEFIQEQNIATQVFAVKDWNPETDELIYDTEIYDPQTQTWTREPPKGKQAEPSSWELYEQFKEYLSVGEDKVSGFTSLDIEYYSPEVAKVWVDALLNKINSKLKARDAEEAQKNVSFLKQQIEETPLASMQSVFYDLIEDQTKVLMLAKGSTEYVFKTVSESRVSEEKSKPKRALICIFGAMLGGLLGCIIALIRGLKNQD
ncbi:lipopolysaccharide biosynthesis protein [Oleiphilus sp. HI0009]|nr:lipopolysaccharide biosynthesis protein [Oleiphilus sp. HI0009]KZY63335.1 lipopolysaccharide biosynthesis protein [Oleiphilus sp. HI0066]KZY74382.1 lipopolysaccharide biosynthesis protein [Oleiphilus sp. HI0067]